MSKYLYPIYKLKTKSYIRWWLYNYLGKFNNYVLSEILTGTSFYLEDSTDRKFNIFDMIGRTTQESDPTPENPVPIKNTGDNGSVNEKIENKNIFNKSKATNGRYVKNTDGTLGYSDTLSASDFIKVRANVTYYQSNVNNYYSCLYDEDKNFIKQINSNSFTPTVDGYMRTSFLTTNIDIVQIEQSSTATSYVPHSGQNLSFPLAQGQKLMEGDYLADDGVHHVRKQIVFDGSDDEVWQGGLFNNLYRYYININDILEIASSDLFNGLCTHFYNSYHVLDSNIEIGMFCQRGGEYNTVFFGTDKTSIAEWKAWLAENPIIVEYELAEEQTEDFTEEQKEAWEQIKNLKTYKPVTHISSEDETPAELKIQYWKEV